MTTEPGRYFTWAELTRSSEAVRRGYDNTPGVAEQAALAALVREVLDPLRDLLGVPLRVSSGFRSPAVNAAIRGAKKSQHVLGEAVDFKAVGIASEEVARRVHASTICVDQCIWYHPTRGGHVHVSHTTTRPNRGQFLYAPAGGGYVPWAP